MSASVTWRNLDEFRSTLSQLPADLTAQAKGILHEAADAAAAEIRAAYPVSTGALVRGVRVSEGRHGRWAGAYRVRSTAPHATIFEQGTKPRQTKKGANRGFMPAADIFVPIAIRHRARMWPALKAIVEKAGFEVHGE